MAGTIKERLNETKTKLDEGRDKVLSELTQRKEELVSRGRRIRQDLDRRRDVTVGRLRDNSLERLYGAGEQALMTAANLVERAEQLTPKQLHVLEGQAQRLRGRAERIEDARDELRKPDIENYDGLNVSDANRAIQALSPYQLQKLRGYEANNKNRVTILREIDRLLGEETD